MVASMSYVVAAISLLSLSAVNACSQESPSYAPITRGKVVLLGDSITDGDTYRELIIQALKEAKLPSPTFINAGIGGDTAADMLKRLDRDVLIHKPKWVSISCGVNDRVPASEFEASLTTILERLKQAKISIILMTPSVPGDNDPAMLSRRVGYCEVMQRLAGSYKARIAPVYRFMDSEKQAGKNLIEQDQVHPNFEGNRIMAKALLHALGRDKTTVPEKAHIELMPGVVQNWDIGAYSGDFLVLAEMPREELLHAASWKALTLPQSVPLDSWWSDQERRRGYAQQLEQYANAEGVCAGWTEVESSKACNVYLSVGAGLQTVWLNGQEIYRAPARAGWHAGRETIKTHLNRGQNRIIIRFQNTFFLSLTSNKDL